MNRLEGIRLLLDRYGQSHLLSHWERLDSRKRQDLLDQLEGIDFPLMLRLFERREKNQQEFNHLRMLPHPLIPLEEQTFDDYAVWSERGFWMLKTGKVAALLVAGGQGTRLGHDGPKGTYSIGLPSGFSLFELQALRILHMQKTNGACIPWLVMTSRQNDRITREFFAEKKYFGLNPEEIFFFSQGELPAIDQNGKILLEAPGQISWVPDGNGGVFKALHRAGGIEWLKARGCTTLFLYGIDNALVRVCDPTIVGIHSAKGTKVTCPVVRKAHSEERVGIFVNSDGRSRVAEYTDIPDTMREARDSKGNLIFDGSNLAIHLLDISVLEAAVDEELPYHAAFKKVAHCDERGETVEPEMPNGWKFEQFMFDIFPRFGLMTAVEVLRAEHFAPVKNAWGDDSPETARTMLLKLHSRWLRNAGVIPVDSADLYEVSPLLSYSGGHLFNRTRNELIAAKLLFPK